MTNIKTLMTLGLVISVATVDGAAQSSTIDSSTRQAIDQYVTGKMHSAHIPGLALAIVKGDRAVYMKGYGRADPSGRAVTPETPFLIGSITKSFTSLAVLQLVEAGQVDLNAPVTRYIPWFSTADSLASSRITVRQLLTMTSGLPQVYETQMWTTQDAGALEQTVRFLKTKKMRAPAGASRTYSNANYETLGLIVQIVSGLSYEDYVVRHIFAPLDMRNSFTSQDEAMRHGMAAGYRWWFGIPVRRVTPFHRAELPAGYIFASAEDMSHYLIAEMNDGSFGGRSVLSPAGMALRHSEPSIGGYGYGWEFATSNGRTLIDHDGGTTNYQTSLFFDPQSRVGVYIAINIVNALDALSSPSGPSPLDGLSSRAMANVVLSMASGQPMPDQGPGHERLVVFFDLAILLLTVVLAVSLARIPKRLRRLEQRGIPSGASLARHVGLVVAVNFALLFVVMYLWFYVPAWPVISDFQPDLAVWLIVVSIVLFIKGAIELSFTAIVFSRTRHAALLPVPAMSSSLDTGSAARKHIVVAGGGVGGLAAARHLDATLRRRTDVDVTLVNRDNFVLLSPLLFEACSGVLELRHCTQPIRPCLRRVRFVEGSVDRIDVERRVVEVIGADGAMAELPYDHVVVALGATTNLSMIRGSEHARTFKTVADGLLLRNHLIEQLERASLESDAERRRQLLTVVVIGGGLVGAELLGEVTAFMSDEIRYYPQLHPDDLQYHLFEAGNRLLPESKAFLANYATKVLQSRGVQLHLSTAVELIEPNGLTWADGEIQAPTIVLAAGIVPSAVSAATAVTRDRKGRIVTDATLRSVSDEHVWAIGDCASTPSPDGKPYPALAQHAVRAARVVASNITATLAGSAPKPFVYEALGMMAAFGHTRAAAEVKRLKFTGFIAWWMRRTYYLFQMPRWETRLRIALDWTVALFYRPDLTKIDLAEEREQERRNRPADGTRSAESHGLSYS